MILMSTFSFADVWAFIWPGLIGGILGEIIVIAIGKMRKRKKMKRK